MNIFSIIEELEKVDPDLNDRFNPRRAAIKNITSFGSKVAMAAAPFALGTLFKRAYGQTVVGDVGGALNFALKLEYLEYEFYNVGVNTAGLIPAGSGMVQLSSIRDHEMQHVNFLQTALTAAGITPVTRASQGFGASFPAAGGTSTGPRYDFTGGGGVGQVSPGVGTGPFSGLFTNYDTFLAVAQVFEDTGVRAYKGQAPNLINNPYLAPALRIHSVEARHAAHLRLMRRARGVMSFPGVLIKPWVSGTATAFNDTGVGTPVDGNYGAGTTASLYPAENNVSQGGATVTSLGLNGSTSIASAVEAYDEPLDAPKVAALVSIFGVK